MDAGFRANRRFIAFARVCAARVCAASENRPFVQLRFCLSLTQSSPGYDMNCGLSKG